MLFCMNYQPDGHDTLQPTIATLMRIARIILVGPLGYTEEAARQYLENDCSIADRRPFKFGYLSSRPTRKIKLGTRKYKPRQIQ